MDNEKISKRELDNYNEIYNVLNQIDIKGHPNVAKMKLTMDFLATLIEGKSSETKRVPVKDK